MIERQLRILTRMVDDLLDFSRMGRCRITLRLEVLDLATVLQEAVEACRPEIDERHHTLSLVLPPHPIYVNGDRTRLLQVVSNLLVNAARYTEPGGKIDLSLIKQGEQAVVRVADTGIGISDEMVSRIFELFAQGEPAHDCPAQGLGLGLPLVRRLMELHGGTVAARSEGPGRGSEFTVRLPIVAAPAPQPKHVDSPACAQHGRQLRHILVVEDNADTAKSMAAILRLWGHDVATAPDGPKALELARRQTPNIVFLDIGLPHGMDGYELAPRLRSLPGMEHALLVAITGFGQPEDCRRSDEAGIDEHLIKPVEPRELQRVIARFGAVNSA
jgi:CheY-like chemotaxis protein